MILPRIFATVETEVKIHLSVYTLFHFAEILVWAAQVSWWLWLLPVPLELCWVSSANSVEDVPPPWPCFLGGQPHKCFHKQQPPLSSWPFGASQVGYGNDCHSYPNSELSNNSWPILGSHYCLSRDKSLFCFSENFPWASGWQQGAVYRKPNLASRV